MTSGTNLSAQSTLALVLTMSIANQETTCTQPSLLSSGCEQIVRSLSYKCVAVILHQAMHRLPFLITQADQTAQVHVIMLVKLGSFPGHCANMFQARRAGGFARVRVGSETDSTLLYHLYLRPSSPTPQCSTPS